MENKERSLPEIAKDCYYEMLETSTGIEFGVIPLLEDLQGKHPDFAEESVFRALEDLRERRDELDNFGES